jgi:Domain of Unknown Function (DUF1080)
MRLLHATAAVLIAGTAVASFPAGDQKDDGFVPMFNGKDLTGWVNVNCAPSTFFVKDGEIITTGKPTGFLRTAKQYENFIAEFDWMHVNTKEVGNSGFFVWADPLPAVGTGYTRGIEVQVLVNLEKPGYYTSQGDLFSIWGATCKPDRPHPHGWARCLPSENRTKGGGEWNHYKVVGNNGVLKLHVNGKEVSGLSECKPRKGYLALESEGAECHFKNLKIKEQPSTNPTPQETADVDRGFRSLYTGLDLTGWKAEGDAAKHWQPRDGVLHYDGKGGPLATDKMFADAEFQLDFRFPKKGTGPCVFVLRGGKGGDVKLSVSPEGRVELGVSKAAGGQLVEGATSTVEGLKSAGQWNRMLARAKGRSFEVKVNGKGPVRLSADVAAEPSAFVVQPAGEMDFRSLFVRELKK